MERLCHSDYARLLDFIACMQVPVPLADFGDHLLRSLAGLIDGAVLAFDQIEESSGFYAISHDFPLAGAEQARIFSRLQDVYQQNPVYAYIRGGGRGVVNIANLATKAAFHRTDFYQDIFRPLRLEHQIDVLLHRPGWINTLTVNSGKEFDGRTEALLTLAARHISAAHETACLLEDLGALRAHHGAPPASLTGREREVFSWMREGKRNSEIAIILGCSPRTVDKHVENILRKTGTETRTAAVRQGA